MSQRWRFSILPTLGIAPSKAEVVDRYLDDAIRSAETRAPGVVTALDAGCGRASSLTPFRRRIARFVGVDIHRPVGGTPKYLDAFMTADLCTDERAFPEASFDVVLSSFTLEHFADPEAAIRTLRRWLRPGGRLVIVTVNRRHPFVGAYLSAPDVLRNPLQRFVKVSADDAHQLVGRCNDPAAVRRALEAAGFEQVRVSTVGHLARAWGGRWPGYVIGIVGDLAAQRFPDRRSTIVAHAVAPA